MIHILFYCFFNDTATTEIYTYCTLFPYTTLFRSQELGGTLVYRDGKDSRLTALGRDIRSEFAAIAEREQRVRAISLNRVRGRRETLTLGVVNTIAPALITGFVTHALRQMPMLELVLQIGRAHV